MKPFLTISGISWFSGHGPGKLCLNLIKGLKQAGVDFHVNKPKAPQVVGALNGILCGFCGVDFSVMSPDSVLGPCIWNVPAEDARTKYALLSRYAGIICASPWHRDLFKTWPASKTRMASVRVEVWAAGIDTDVFVPGGTKTTDCLLYMKRRDPKELRIVEDLLSRHSQTYVIMGYDTKYKEADFIAAQRRCRYAFVLVGSETQGLAVMETMSAGLPCAVWNRRHWNRDRRVPATSVPYFDATCGYIFRDAPTDPEFREFLEHVPRYRPAEYVRKNFTLKTAAENYVKTLQKFKPKEVRS